MTAETGDRVSPAQSETPPTACTSPVLRLRHVGDLKVLTTLKSGNISVFDNSKHNGFHCIL